MKNELFYQEVDNMAKTKETKAPIGSYKRLVIEKGLKEGQEIKTKELAQKMKNEGLDINLIIKITGLNKEEISKL